MIEMKASQRMRLPYMGSKQALTERLINAMYNEMPEADTFVDLFGGGGSMTCHALDCGYKVVYNELNKEIGNLLEFCLTTDFMKDYNSKIWQFVSREEFYKIKEYQPKTNKALAYKTAILLCYSFGNQMQTYICQKSKEIFKKTGHNLVIHADRKSAEFWADYYKETLGHLYIEACEDYFKDNEDRVWRRGIFLNMTLKIEAITVAYRWNNKFLELYKKYNLHDLLLLNQKELCKQIISRCPDIPRKKYQSDRSGRDLKELKQLQQLQQLQNLQNLQQLENLENLERLQQLERLENLRNLERLERLEQLERLERLTNRLTFFNLDYRECFELIKNKLDKNKTIIYCDSPYKNVKTYNQKTDIEHFNHTEYKEWLTQMYKDGWKVFISEYTNYDNYKELLSIQVQNKMAMGNVDAENFKTYKNEKLFININKKEYKKVKEAEILKEYPLFNKLAEA